MNDFWHRILFRIGNFVLTPTKLLGFLMVILAARLLLYLLKRILIGKTRLEPAELGGRSSLYKIISYIIWIIAISSVVSIAGFNITFLVASSAALLVGLGFGLQNIFSDLVSGLFILFERKVKVGDVMEVDNIVGKVEQISLRTSVLMTRDGYNIIVPNHKFITENVINWTHQGFQRRFQLEVGVSYSSDVKKVSDILIQTAKEQPEVLTDWKHQPFVRFQDFGDSALIFYLMFWTTDIFRVEQVKSNMRYKIFDLFREHQIEIPFPQRVLHMRNP